ncbi:hypothetical protein [Microbacterium sp. Leaf436]|uniref:hypothetical protein n=1 Tax=Microbacterium sp. Leaf436 TaxID=1736377 RepID=UPI0006F3C0D8|nr:hypothetical protein [Microbacterium sp. Leaf436]KQT75658.1 hypothetical protein ASG45_04035 [Microbacterium sp. Leaf436]
MSTPIALVRTQLDLLRRHAHPIAVAAVADQLDAAARDAPASDLVTRAAAATGRAAAALAADRTPEAAEQMGICVRTLSIISGSARL